MTDRPPHPGDVVRLGGRAGPVPGKVRLWSGPDWSKTPQVAAVAMGTRAQVLQVLTGQVLASIKVRILEGPEKNEEGWVRAAHLREEGRP